MVLALAISALAQTSAYASRTDEIQAWLTQFDKNPASVIDAQPVKLDSSGKAVTQLESPFSKKDRQSGAYVEKRMKSREKICKTYEGKKVCAKDILKQGRAPWGENDDVVDLVDNSSKPIRSLTAMDKKKLTSAHLPENPWSGDYWGIYRGSTAARYADSAFPNSKNWKENFDYISSKPLTSLFSNSDKDMMNSLSPSEKYDLLTGSKGALTAAEWKEGQNYFDSDGKVEDWMGICHGWAPAAYMVPRPTHTVEAIAANGKTKIKFYPHDLKALSSLLWAKAGVSSRFIGGRCDEKNPKKDSNGRVKIEECFDTNPGTWHMSVVNQIGVSKRSFVIDATYDYEVWNQPVVSYSYTYFNPQTREPAANLKTATIKKELFTADKFKKYRSAASNSFVGIAMDLTYISETEASSAEVDSAADDLTRTVRYMYDLEIDKTGKIVGGEWYMNAHPDFLWTPAPETEAVTQYDDSATGTWSPTTSALPASWSKAAQSAAHYDLPISKIVNALIESAHR